MGGGSMEKSFDGEKTPARADPEITYREFLDSEFEKVYRLVYRYAPGAEGKDDYFSHVFGHPPEGEDAQLAQHSRRRRKTLSETYADQRKPLGKWWQIVRKSLNNLKIDLSRRKKELQFPATSDGSHFENDIQDAPRPRGLSVTEIRDRLIANGMPPQDAEILIAVD